MDNTGAGSQGLQRPVRNDFRPWQTPRLPVSTDFVARVEHRERVFEPRPPTSGVVDYDDLAPLEPPRSFQDLARSAAERVVNRLELFEQSPVLRELQSKGNELEEGLEEIAEQVLDVARRLEALEQQRGEEQRALAAERRVQLEQARAEVGACRAKLQESEEKVKRREWGLGCAVLLIGLLSGLLLLRATPNLD